MLSAVDRWTIKLVGVAAVIIVLATGYGVARAMRPAPQLPVNGITLHASVERASGSAGALFEEVDACVKRRRPGSWDCSVLDREGSGGADYRVRVAAGATSWTAHRTADYSEGGMPKRVRGCLRGDRWSPWDLLL
jgi:hypothetical protein